MEKITLLGHVSQTGQYPAPVVAIGRLESRVRQCSPFVKSIYRGKLVAAMRHGADLHWEYTELDDDYEYEQHAVFTRDFDPEEHGLFALAPNNVEVFENAKARDFFRRVLQYDVVKKASPFVRIGFVREAELWDDVPAVLMEQLDSVENRAAFVHLVREQLERAERAAGRKLGAKALEERLAQIEEEYW